MKTETEKLPFTNENLKQLIVSCLDCELEIDRKGRVTLKKEPEMPTEITVSSYDNYVQKLTDWRQEMENLKSEYSDLKEDLKRKKYELQNIIPTWNIWFVTDCGKYAAAIKLYNWGGTKTELLFTNDTSDLQNLKAS